MNSKEYFEYNGKLLPRPIQEPTDTTVSKFSLKVGGEEFFFSTAEQQTTAHNYFQESINLLKEEFRKNTLNSPPVFKPTLRERIIKFLNEQYIYKN